MLPALEWRRYDARGTRPRVRAFVVRGTVEYELCAEGGQAVIRRTVRNGARVTVSETARGLTRETEAVWALISIG